MPVKFLCVADVHIGRSSSEFENKPDTSALDAWHRIVETAINLEVAAVLIAGDLFDDDISELRNRDQVLETLETLSKKNIDVIAVAGNHDHAALPNLAAQAKQREEMRFKLLASEHWESTQVRDVRIIGRSFGDRAEVNLFDNWNVNPSDDVTIAIMHADINANSPYNPTPILQLNNRGVNAWVLGHVHATKQWSDPLAVYPGSPQALDAGETGVHGCYLLEVDGGNCNFTNIPISSVRYESITLDYNQDNSKTGKLSADIDNLVNGWLAENEIKRTDKIALKITVNDFVLSHNTDNALKTLLERNEYTKNDTLLWKIDLVNPRMHLDLIAESRQSSAGGQAARLLIGFKDDTELETMTELKSEEKDLWKECAEKLFLKVKDNTEQGLELLERNNNEEIANLSKPSDYELKAFICESLWQVLQETHKQENMENVQ